MSVKAKEVKEKYAPQLLKYTGVTGIGYNHSITVYVEKLTPQLQRFIPTTLDGVNVNIVETGKITPLPLMVPVTQAIYAARTDRVRPAPGGVSVGHVEVTAGTLGCRAIDNKTQKYVGLTNNHVAALQWGTDKIGKVGDSILQPGPYDGGIDPDDKIGELLRWIDVEVDPAENLIDAAIFSSDLLKGEVEEIGEIESVLDPEIGMNIMKSGRTSGLNYSQIYDVDATVKVSGSGDCLFTNQIIAKPALLDSGDSGSWVGHADSYRTIGLGFAGSSEISIINKGKNVEELLDITIIPPTEEDEALPYISMNKVSLGLAVASVALGSYQVFAPKRRPA